MELRVDPWRQAESAMLRGFGLDLAAKRMQTSFQKLAADINGHPINATLSVGMVFSPQGPLDLPALLVQADEALYLAKELGRNRIEIASPETVWKSTPPAEAEQSASRKKMSAA